MAKSSNNEKYVQVPHWLMDYLMTAGLNMTQFRIVHVVIRHTFGFHKIWNQFSLTFLSEQTGCNKRQVTRELGKLIEQKILIERYDGAKRMLCINCAELMHTLIKQVEGSDSLDTTGGDSLDTRGSDSLDTHIKKEVKKEVKERIYIDFNQIDDPFIKTYFEQFKRLKNKQHMRITEEQYQNIVEQIDLLHSFGVTVEEWEAEVMEHFKELPKSNNGNIIAFLHAAPRRFDVG
ncbi:hypothetical protein J23TS9_05860 [Paenibacillus sp. J23TS9]|uniref:replication protein n=1 Tax=Paenibacillus sp. J23TS9 TaxID=2807193 RepID=UPI001B282B23|nr:replication protein [Paenibacillus sp. J23TS9]GIP25456.1 hypothetical protein J23TS9_05860 [Paenibacillus sp. J23TS9]